MADKEEFNPSGGDEFSLQPCTRAEESAPKRKKTPAAGAGHEGCAPKRRGEEASEEEPWRAVGSLLTALEAEEGGDSDSDSDYEEFMAGIRASYAANVEKLLGNHPNVMWVDFPSCCVRPPGVEFPKPPCTPRPDVQNDATEEDEELGGAVATPPVSG